ncbi:peptide ABC transporter substrate-binding protein [Flavimaricola marinus]|uniref:Periplasmic oligopeptide-binding protein n=1 Tax=Flavimaricola marinus TaxID=1819565 RepID=A0A238LCH9_9RHOB|nr:peptide ABC transporter substrate-binding protein [Flavimaricola marinus]SMY06646.1 Periplasmic oligopeptide-binding protein precursor [Flavimaricola marinus]
MTFKATLMAGTATALIALAGQAMADAHATHPVTGQALASDQSFTYRVLDDYPSIDPQLIQDVEGSSVARDLFEGLMNEDAEGNVIPGVATGYEVSEDGLVYTFTLRPEAKWSDGVQVTAQQFVDGIRRAADPATASEYAWFLEVAGIANAGAVTAGEMPVEELGVAAIDDMTLEITIDAPRPYFPQTSTFPTLFPARLDKIEEFGDSWMDPENIVVNGAYTLQEYTPAEKLVRVRNDMYWNNEATILETVTALIIPDENAALTRFLAGELDMTDIPAGQYPRLAEEYPDQAISFPNSCSYYYMFNMSDSGPEALSDARVRQALSMAVDRDIIVENVLAGGQRPAYTFTHWAIPGWEIPDIPMANMTQAERNEQAKALMAEAGFGEDNPLNIELIYNTSDSHAAIAVAIGQMWKQTLGVETTLANQEWATFLDTRGNQNYEIARGGWCADYAEPSTYLDLFTSSSSYNDGKYNNPEVDALMAEAKLSDDPLSLYQEVESIAAADAAIIPIYHYASVKMMAPTLENWPTENLLQNWYSRDLYISASE